MSDIPTDAGFWLRIWGPIVALLTATITLHGISSNRISKAETSAQEGYKECVEKLDCKEDRENLHGYVQEIKNDIHKRMDALEKNIINAIKGG